MEQVKKHLAPVAKNETKKLNMKHLISTLLFIAIVGTVTAQRRSILNAGVGYYLYTDNISQAENIYSINGFPHVFLEKPIYLPIKQKDRFLLTPGISYTKFKERGEKGDAETLDKLTLDHTTFRAYTKIALLTHLNRSTLYFGVNPGYTFNTKTEGSIAFTSSKEDGPDDSFVNISNDGSGFFESFSYGFMVGIYPGIEGPSRFEPVFEVGYYPQYIKSGERSGDLIELSLIISFRTKE